ncbi:MAG TPA: hypothetical protein VFL81_01060 [Candidatus Saccharimonadales bacterium]|nr:hypothetical protein [Candidatus Saccharimonadales bacterium]
MIRNSQFQSGFVMIALLIATMFVMVAGTATAALAASNYRTAKDDQYRLDTQLAADGGLDKAVYELNQNNDWAGSGGEQTLIDNGRYKSTYETTVTNGADELHKIITVTARTYAFGATVPASERSYSVVVRGINAGSFSVVTGVGGLEMLNSSKIIGGSVYVNGTISMTNTAQIGLASNPVNVQVANQSCPKPADSTYPRLCNPGENENPINITLSAHIYGTVTANDQTDGHNMTSPGLTSGSVSPQTLPDYDRAAQISAVTTTLSASDAACTSTSGTVDWPANLKIVGDLSLTQKCKIIVHGNVWITGNLSLSNSSQVIVADGLSTPPTIMVDGAGGVDATNGSSFTSNSGDIGFLVITYWSKASCSPDCSSVSGSELYDSSQVTTINLENSSTGPNTEFYARWSRVQLANSGNIGALVGQEVRLTNSSAVTFGTEVSGAGGIIAWVIDSYQRAY